MVGVGRSTHAQALLGKNAFNKIRHSKVLVVGAGGIGCELLKNLVLVGFGNIEIIDLDTIDLSNLNRQFLFRKTDIKKSKALVASAFAHQFNPGPGPSQNSSVDGPGSTGGVAVDAGKGVNIKARHGNIKEPENDVEWMKGFDLVMSALDNMDARRHVNRLCVSAGVPLIESGTQGYLGQVTPMQKDRTECYDCVSKPTPKTFPVCTIRATPSEPIHCIVWGKSYLLPKLFGEDDEASDEQELEKAKATDQDASVAEIEELKKEAAAFRDVRKGLNEEDGAKKTFEKVFGDDIRRLLKMEDMWKVPGRVKPVPLDYNTILDGSFRVPPLAKAASAPGKEGPVPASTSQVNPAPATSVRQDKLKDQQELSIKQNLELFLESCKKLSARGISNPGTLISFDKDDDDTLDFVLATANLRATAYGIPTKTRFEVKEMAGNIIPAIATTNAVIAGYIVMRAMNILQNDWSKCSNVYLRGDPARLIAPIALQPPEDDCGVCADVYVPLACDVERLTLGSFVGEIVRSWLGWDTNGDGDQMEIAVYEDKRLLADPDFEDNYGKTLADLGITRGKTLTVTDEDNLYRNVNFSICALPASANSTFHLPSNAPQVPRRPKAPEPAPTSSVPSVAGTKRSADDFDILSASSSKKQKLDANGAAGSNGDKGPNGPIDLSDDEIEIL